MIIFSWYSGLSWNITMRQSVWSRDCCVFLTNHWRSNLLTVRNLLIWMFVLFFNQALRIDDFQIWITQKWVLDWLKRINGNNIFHSKVTMWKIRGRIKFLTPNIAFLVFWLVPNVSSYFRAKSSYKKTHCEAKKRLQLSKRSGFTEIS